MVDALDIAVRLLRRLGGALSDAELSAWAHDRLREMQGEDAGPFAGEEESLKDVLKRCAIAADPGFSLSDEEMRDLVDRLGSSSAPLTPERLKSTGPFLVCRRVGLLRAGKGAFRSVCPRCASPIFLPERLFGRWAESGAALLCARCAGSRPGRIVNGIPAGSEPPTATRA